MGSFPYLNQVAQPDHNVQYDNIQLKTERKSNKDLTHPWFAKLCIANIYSGSRIRTLPLLW